jgi:hypothetical protein
VPPRALLKPGLQLADEDCRSDAIDREGPYEGGVIELAEMEGVRAKIACGADQRVERCRDLAAYLDEGVDICKVAGVEPEPRAVIRRPVGSRAPDGVDLLAPFEIPPEQTCPDPAADARDQDPAHTMFGRSSSEAASPRLS